MPYTVRKVPKRGYAIVNKATGKVAGYSRTKGQARTSARIRSRKGK